MTFPSVYEMTTSIDTIKKQHFWDYFSGKELIKSGESYTFSNNSGWGSTNASVSSSSLTVNTSTASGTNRAASYDLGSAQDGNFTLKFKVSVPTQGHNNVGYANGLGFGLSSADHSTSSLSSQDFIGANYMHDNIDRALGGNWSKNAKMHSNSCSGSDSTYGYPITGSGACNPAQNAWGANSSRWIKIERTSDTTFIVSYYTSSGYGTPAATRTITMSSVPSGLQYIVFKNMYLTSTQGNGETVTVSELTFESDDVEYRWHYKDLSGTNTPRMSTSEDGGFEIASAGASANQACIDFADKRTFNPRGAVCIGVARSPDLTTGSDGMSYNVGFIDRKDYSFDVGAALNFALSFSYGGFTHFSLHSGNPTEAGSYLDSTTAIDNNWHVHKVETLPTGTRLTLDGVMGAIKTTKLPESTSKLQPRFDMRDNTGGGVHFTAIRYMEAFNT